MIKTELQGLSQLLRISAPFLITTTLYALAFFAIEEQVGDHLYKLPGQVGSVFGLAVAFFLGFRMNSAYDRWWEARKILGELTNNARSFSAKTRTYFDNPENIDAMSREQRAARARDLIDLLALYVQQLTNELQGRFTPKFAPQQVALMHRYRIETNHKISNEILLAMSDLTDQSFSRGAAIEKSDLMQHINRFYDVQGQAERIRNTPFLKIYGAFTRLVMSSYVLLLPFFLGDIDLGGEGSQFEILVVPVIVVISTAFLTINSLANRFAEPFAEHGTSLMIDEICENIVANCLQVRSKIRFPSHELASQAA